MKRTPNLTSGDLSLDILNFSAVHCTLLENVSWGNSHCRKTTVVMAGATTLSWCRENRFVFLLWVVLCPWKIGNEKSGERNINKGQGRAWEAVGFLKAEVKTMMRMREKWTKQIRFPEDGNSDTHKIRGFSRIRAKTRAGGQRSICRVPNSWQFRPHALPLSSSLLVAMAKAIRDNG